MPVSTGDINEPNKSNQRVFMVNKIIPKTTTERVRQFRVRKQQIAQENVQIRTDRSREYKVRKRLPNDGQSNVFPHYRAGEKLEKKIAEYVNRNNLDQNAFRIARRNATVPLNKNETFNAKRNHFPLLAGNSLTIHKAQGGTFGEVPYRYKKGHSNKLVYAALSRVTNLEGLYIIPENNVKRFYHGLIEPHHKSGLHLELERFCQNHHTPIVDLIADFISKRKGLSVFSFNCQSRRSHFNDLNDQVTQRANILILSETRLENEQEQSMPNLN